MIKPHFNVGTKYGLVEVRGQFKAELLDVDIYRGRTVLTGGFKTMKVKEYGPYFHMNIFPHNVTCMFWRCSSSNTLTSPTPYLI